MFSGSKTSTLKLVYIPTCSLRFWFHVVAATRDSLICIDGCDVAWGVLTASTFEIFENNILCFFLSFLPSHPRVCRQHQQHQPIPSSKKKQIPLSWLSRIESPRRSRLAHPSSTRTTSQPTSFRLSSTRPIDWPRRRCILPSSSFEETTSSHPS